MNQRSLSSDASRVVHFERLQARASANNEQPIVVERGGVVEACLRRAAVGHVVQLPEPINNLAIPLLVAPGPFEGRLLTGLHEDAVRRGILEFDETVRSPFRNHRPQDPLRSRRRG